ncbi:MAG: hypothetical protein AVDCRST_MAG93-6562 [uncultured Chloroflexia bacterium]|uniref:Helix-turn-helix domain-containing protein n=1 Tax=uncultured Chloroflexia bacterium TaxID=1672391 RepID=A0A6J4LQV6_9CHLR|nr:MAG: hypothetical protein AVDCRST_MAG93-6562 [uncultured Chloroflexia bacterium]
MSDTPGDQGLHISIAEAAEVLHVGIRQVHNHISAGRIRSRKQGRRRLLVAADVYRLAEELDAAHRELQRSAPDGATGEYLPANVQYIQAELARALVYTGQLEEQLKTRLAPAEAEELRRQLAAAEGRTKALEEQIAFYRKPWWRRVLGI